MDRRDVADLRPTLTRDRGGRWLMLFTPAGFEWTHLALPVPGLPAALRGLRIVHLSDLHLNARWHRAYDRLGQRLAASPPDLLLFTGDFVDHKFDHRTALPVLRRLLPLLRARLGTYAILGNHDVDLIAPYVRDLGVHLIDGARALLRSAATFDNPAASIELIGLPGVARHDLDADFVIAQPPKAPNTLRIVLSHYPDHVRRVRPLRPDLVLAGHTHGGQICLPGGRALLSHDALPKRLAKGVHRVNDTWLVVSRGMGFAGVPVRFFCPTEVVEITVE